MAKVNLCQKMFLTYIHKIAVLNTHFQKSLSFIYTREWFIKRFHLIATGKQKSIPFIRKKFALTYMKKTGVLWGVLENVLQFVYRNRPCKQKMRLSAHIKEEWALDTHPIELLIFILSQGQKEGFSHQMHT